MPYESPASAIGFTVDLDNIEPHIDDSKYSRGRVPRDKILYPYGAVNAPFDESLRIPMSEWDDRIEEQERLGTSLEHILRRNKYKGKDQNGLPYCWIFACVGAIEAIRCREGLPYVELSAVSCGAKITGFRSRGGMGMEGMEFIPEHGIVPTSLWPECKLSRQYDTPEAWKAAEQFKLVRWMDVPDGDIEAMGSCLLRNIPLTSGYDGWGHEVWMGRLLKKGNKYVPRGHNSWGDDWGDDGWMTMDGSNRGMVWPNDCEAPMLVAYDGE